MGFVIFNAEKEKIELQFLIPSTFSIASDMLGFLHIINDGSNKSICGIRYREEMKDYSKVKGCEYINFCQHCVLKLIETRDEL